MEYMCFLSGVVVGILGMAMWISRSWSPMMKRALDIADSSMITAESSQNRAAKAINRWNRAVNGEDSEDVLQEDFWHLAKAKAE